MRCRCSGKEKSSCREPEKPQMRWCGLAWFPSSGPTRSFQGLCSGPLRNDDVLRGLGIAPWSLRRGGPETDRSSWSQETFGSPSSHVVGTQ